MNRERSFKIYTFSVIAIGIAALGITIFQLDSRLLNRWFILFAIFTVTVASRMSIQLPRINVALTFSDAMIFIAFLMFGGKEAVFVSAIEMISTCFFLKRGGFDFARYSFAFNIASSVLTTTLSVFLIYSFTTAGYITYDYTDVKNLAASLGILALSQFFINSGLVATYVSLKNGISFGESWQKSGLTISITQITGASFAGILSRINSLAEVVISLVAFTILSIVYFSYRKVMSDIDFSVKRTEELQVEKAEVETLRAEQAETHAFELGKSLEEQERISEKLQESLAALERSAFTDSLTQLPNRAYLVERLRALFELRIDFSDQYYVLFLDLKKFKNINNRIGHDLGDEILILISKRLQTAVKMEDTVARIGGNEFAIIVTDIKSLDEVTELAGRIHEKLTEPFSFHGHKIFIDLNIGISPFARHHKKPEDILRDADIAMHHAKETNQGFAVFDKDLSDRILKVVKIENCLRFALENKELAMHYQPLISLTSGELIGFEALLRWKSKELGMISPFHFIPIAEESGLIIPITDWILEETTSQLAKWQTISPAYKDIVVSVNISGKHIAHDGLVETIAGSLKRSGIDPFSLKLEITESTAMEDAERSVNILNQLKELGTQLSIDDFGTGYSSLSYLHRLPFDTLKIDRSFVMNAGENGENSEILQTVISLARNLKMKVIAEGIETESQLRLLRNLGCDFGQGYLMAKPMPREEMETLLYQKQLWFPQTFMQEEFGDEYSSTESAPILYKSEIA